MMLQEAAGLPRELAEHHRVAGAAVVGREHDPVPRRERGAQPLDAAAAHRDDAVGGAQVAGEPEREQARDERPAGWRHEAVRLGDDDVLHGRALRPGPPGTALG